MFSPSETVLGEIADLSRGNGHSTILREASICIIASVNWASYGILLPESGSGLILADSYRWFSRRGVMLKSKSEAPLSREFIGLRAWSRPQAECLRAANCVSGVRASGGPMLPTSDACLDWTTKQTRWKDHPRLERSSWRRWGLNAASPTAQSENASAHRSSRMERS